MARFATLTIFFITAWALTNAHGKEQELSRFSSKTNTFLPPSEVPVVQEEKENFEVNPCDVCVSVVQDHYEKKPFLCRSEKDKLYQDEVCFTSNSHPSVFAF